LKLKSKENSTPYYLRVTIDREVADKFHDACHRQGVTVSSVITASVIEFSKTQSCSTLLPTLKSRKQRKKELHLLTTRLKRIFEVEAGVLFNTPTNFIHTPQYGDTEDIVIALEHAIDTLDCTYR
jgi:hypothetical protein